MSNAQVKRKDVTPLRIKPRSKIVVKVAEVPPDMIERAIAPRGRSDDVAQYLKSNFDLLYPAPWHCIVGRQFSSAVTHSRGSFLYFFVGHLAVVLFRCKEQPRARERLRHQEVVKRYGPTTEPKSFVKDIEAALDGKL
ncbi:Dynein light chain [Aphelenchoides fujianensis]|nr:Dynein light chain [Aphelenchoides fujianensis]